jgi:type II secretory pathway component GspD/PulD (secretin)
MKRITLTLLALIIAALSIAQTSAPAKASAIETVTIASKGKDVRDVLSDLFEQGKKSFVVEPNIHFVLFLSLNDVEFEEALDLICKTANLKYKEQNGIYFITRDKGFTTITPVVAGVSVSRVPDSSLRKKVTVTGDRMDLRVLFRILSEQTNVPLVVDAKVPAYKIDIVLKGTSLKYALITVCKAAGLTYKFTDDATIQIMPIPDMNRITVHTDSSKS